MKKEKYKYTWAGNLFDTREEAEEWSEDKEGIVKVKIVKEG